MKQLAWAIALMLPLAASADEVYRSVDANGQVVYSDRPSAETTTERVAVNAPRPTSTASGRAVAARPAADEESGSEDPVQALIPREPTPEEIAADRVRNCDYARQMQSAYSQAHRLFRENADGEREYLSDAEITAARDKAESDVAAWCD